MPRFRSLAVLILLTFGCPPTARAQEATEPTAEAVAEPEPFWSGEAEFSLLLSRGNTEVETLALGGKATRKFERASLTFSTGAVRAETTTTTRSAAGTPDDFVVSEISESTRTAENYTLQGRYQRQISNASFWFTGATWEQDEFAGVDSRLTGVAGVGRTWRDDERLRLLTDVGLTFTDEEELSGRSESFAGVRLGYQLWKQVTPTTTFQSDLVLDGNLDESSDYRADLKNSLTVTISTRLALRLSLSMAFDNQPARVEVPLFGLGSAEAQTVAVPLDDLDSTLTAALVVGF